MVDCPLHVNYEVTKLYVEEIFDFLKEYQMFYVKSRKDNLLDIRTHFDIVKDLYLKYYFLDTDVSESENIGCVVMNANPFTNGHLYLVEYACTKVDRLIVFVISEDKLDFSFEERFHMVKEGTKHIPNVTVVPRGDHVISKDTLPNYFIKKIDDNLATQLIDDITIFAKKIAKPLKITK